MKDQVQELAENVQALVDLILKSNAAIDSNFDIVNQKIDSLTARVHVLSEKSNQEFGNVGQKLNDIHIEISKIQKVSNYASEYENLLKISKK